MIHLHICYVATSTSCIRFSSLHAFCTKRSNILTVFSAAILGFFGWFSLEFTDNGAKVISRVLQRVNLSQTNLASFPYSGCGERLGEFDAGSKQARARYERHYCHCAAYLVHNFTVGIWWVLDGLGVAKGIFHLSTQAGIVADVYEQLCRQHFRTSEYICYQTESDSSYWFVP